MKKIFLTLSIALFSVASIFAQTKTKIGYVNSTELLALMPARATAEKTLAAEAEALQKQLQAMSAEYQTKISDFQANQETMSDLMKETKVKEISDLEGRIQTFQESAQQSLQAKEAELLEPILTKARDAVKATADKAGYTHVFDTASGILIHAPEGDDILPLVKKDLGL